jgi:hypothetical protein
MTTISNGIVHRGEDPELRRHRIEVLAKSRVWRILVVLALLATLAYAAVMLTLEFG